VDGHIIRRMNPDGGPGEPRIDIDTVGKDSK
jgi:hypothetical protein